MPVPKCPHSYTTPSYPHYNIYRLPIRIIPNLLCEDDSRLAVVNKYLLDTTADAAESFFQRRLIEYWSICDLHGKLPFSITSHFRFSANIPIEFLIFFLSSKLVTCIIRHVLYNNLFSIFPSGRFNDLHKLGRTF